MFIAVFLGSINIQWQICCSQSRPAISYVIAMPGIMRHYELAISRTASWHPRLQEQLYLFRIYFFYLRCVEGYTVLSVLWRCWLGGRKGPACKKTWVVGYWHGYLSGARCRLHMAQLMSLPLTVSCFSKIQIGFTFLVPTHLGSPGKGPLNGCVCVCVYVWRA